MQGAPPSKKVLLEMRKLANSQKGLSFIPIEPPMGTVLKEKTTPQSCDSTRENLEEVILATSKATWTPSASSLQSEQDPFLSEFHSSPASNGICKKIFKKLVVITLDMVVVLFTLIFGLLIFFYNSFSLDQIQISNWPIIPGGIFTERPFLEFSLAFLFYWLVFKFTVKQTLGQILVRLFHAKEA